MKFSKAFKAGLLATAFCLCCAVYAAVDTDTIGKLDMVSINKMQMRESDSAYILDVEVTFENKGQDALKLRNGVFQTSIDTKEKDQDVKLDLGGTTVDEIVIPGAKTRKTPGTVTKMVSITMGPKDSATIAKLFRLWNVLGNPSAAMVMVLKGTAEIGVQIPKGWAFEQGKSYEVELHFLPTVQRKVLFM